MDDLQSQLSAVMGNPEMMEKIMSLAQNLGAEPTSASAPPPSSAPSGDIPDMAMLAKLTGIMGKAGIDKKEQNLLNALHPYLSSHRVSKLEKAMRAAKMAGMATVFLSGR